MLAKCDLVLHNGEIVMLVSQKAMERVFHHRFSLNPIERLTRIRRFSANVEHGASKVVFDSFGK